ncbi:MAG TPA: hypothetical protein VIM70_23260 [Clostridium sp.]|uniref:hypothetical protein n=1 Tax=Clostridium sp. TaxID=1506 RepID=UPI002F928C72
MKNKHSIIILCQITSGILFISYFIGNMENKNLLYFSIIPAIIQIILSHKKDDIPGSSKQYARYNGLKKAILKNKNSIITLCRITTIILIICFLAGNRENKILFYFSIIALIIEGILSHKEDDYIPEIPKEYARYNGLKKALSILMSFWIIVVIIGFCVFFKVI